jgi:hypothetical protein
MNSSFHLPPQGTEPVPTNSTAKILLIVLGAVGAMVLLICGGLGVFGYVFVRNTQDTFAEAMADVMIDEDGELIVMDSLQDEPKLKAKIGDVQSVVATSAPDRFKEKSTSIDFEHYWYNIKGSQGEAYVRMKSSPRFDELFDSAELWLDGTQFERLAMKKLPYDNLACRSIYLAVHKDSEVKKLVGEITEITEDDGRTEREISEDDDFYFYLVRGKLGTVSVKGEVDWDDTVRSLWYEDKQRKMIPIKVDLPPTAPKDRFDVDAEEPSNEIEAERNFEQ